MMIRNLLTAALLLCATAVHAQQLPAAAQAELEAAGFRAGDLAGLVLKDSYRSAHNGATHHYFRQRWQGIEVWNGDIAIHQLADGSLARINNGAFTGLEKRVNATAPLITAEAALGSVLRKTLPSTGMPQLLSVEDEGRRWVYEGSGLGGEKAVVQLVYQPVRESLRLAWNVNHYTPDGSHWWNIRIDALSGEELDRNDWVAQCGWGECVHTDAGSPEEDSAPAAPNDYNVYPWPTESPSHGPRGIRNAPWGDGGVASPYGWHDTNGAAGPEYTDTRGNNCRAQDDVDANNSGGTRPSGGATLDFDFPIDLTQAPSTYLPAAITNLFYWNNVCHDVWYQYGFDEASGNFQENNYGRGGAGNDWVNADAQDGSGTNNANFGTPPDGSNPRMQMFRWTNTSPQRDSDLDNGVIAHEYGHGISNRLVGGPSNTSCLANNEQMGEGWSDYFALVMTMKPGDTGPMGRGIGTYLLGQPTTGAGIRPARYSTSFAVNDYTYANTNSGISQPHGIGFVWCTMLWEMTWELINVYGFDPDIYNGTGGNNIAMQLVIDGLKLTPCNPGFVDGRDAILLADQINNGGANQDYIWAAFARRGLGASADQGSTTSRTDQTEAFDTPVPNNVGVFAIVSPPVNLYTCPDGVVPVVVEIRNSGSQPQSGFPVSYSVNGGAPVTEIFTGTIGAGGLATFSFSQAATLSGSGPFDFVVGTALAGDQLTSNDQQMRSVTPTAATVVPATYSQDVEGGSTTPAGWALQNPDNGITWSTTQLTNGALCASSRAWSIDYYAYPNTGREDRLISPVVDLSASAGTRLKFHHAYVIYAAGYEDGMRVEVSGNCGATWTTVFEQSGLVLATAPASTSSWTPTNCSQWRLNDIDLSAFDGGSVMVRFTGINGYGNNLYLDNVVVESNGVRVALDLMLQGPYNPDTDRMRDDLRAEGLLPLTEPFTALGMRTAGPATGETTDTGVLAVTGDNAIVDWVLLELRDATAAESIVATRAALVQRDGDVVDKDGVSPVTFTATTGNYHVAVRHRNHLGCMTAAPVALSGTATNIDLTSAATATYGTDARRAEGTRMLLWAGNVLRDATLRYTGEDNDRDPILQSIGGSVPTNTSAAGYHQEDVNMDGVVRYTGEDNDRDPILLNIGGSIPTNTRPQQLP